MTYYITYVQETFYLATVRCYGNLILYNFIAPILSKLGAHGSVVPSSRTTALGLTQPITEMSTRNLPGE
jgi:hypothetical protein